MTPDHDNIECKKCFYLRLTAVVLWTVGLVFGSLVTPHDEVHVFQGQDKVLHFTVYFLTAWLVCRATILFDLSLKKAFAYSAIYCMVLGGLLEYLQATLTVSRQAESLDLLANAAGALAGSAIFCLFVARRSDTGRKVYESDSSEN